MTPAPPAGRFYQRAVRIWGGWQTLGPWTRWQTIAVDGAKELAKAVALAATDVLPLRYAEEAGQLRLKSRFVSGAASRSRLNGTDYAGAETSLMASLGGIAIGRLRKPREVGELVAFLRRIGQRQSLVSNRLSMAALCRCRHHHLPTRLTGAGPHVDDPVAGGDDAHVVLDDDHRVAGVDEPVELRQQLLDVGGMQPGRRLVEHVERVAALRALQLGRELDPLRLAARQLGRRLAQAQIAEAHCRAPASSGARTRRLVGEERRTRRRRSCRARRRCSCRDTCTSSVFGVVARAVAGRAGRIHARQEQQLDA